MSLKFSILRNKAGRKTIIFCLPDFGPNDIGNVCRLSSLPAMKNLEKSVTPMGLTMDEPNILNVYIVIPKAIYLQI